MRFPFSRKRNNFGQQVGQRLALQAQIQQAIRSQLPASAVHHQGYHNVPPGLFSAAQLNGIEEVSTNGVQGLDISFNPVKAVKGAASSFSNIGKGVVSAPFKAFIAVPKAAVKTVVGVAQGQNVFKTVGKNAFQAAKDTVFAPVNIAYSTQKELIKGAAAGFKKDTIKTRPSVAEAAPAPSSRPRFRFSPTSQFARQVQATASTEALISATVSPTSSNADELRRRAAAGDATAMAWAQANPAPPPQAPSPEPMLMPAIVPSMNAAGPTYVNPTQPQPTALPPSISMQAPTMTTTGAATAQLIAAQQEGAMAMEQAIQTAQAAQAAQATVPDAMVAPTPPGVSKYLKPGLAVGGGALALLLLGAVVSRRRRRRNSGVNAYDYED